MVWLVLFTLSTGFALYVLFGYPVLLWILARRYRPVHRAPTEHTVSIIIAVHNGEGFIEKKLRSVFALDYPADKIQVVVSCDGCTDATAEIAERAGGGRVTILQLPKGGKAIAINAAMEVATNEILFFTDVRQDLDSKCLRYLLESFADPKVGVVSGQLVIQTGDTHEEADTGLYWRYEYWVRTQLSRIDSFFGATGACYAMRRNLTVPIPANTVLDDMYEPLAAFFQGFRLITDARARAFDFPTKLDDEFDRKVRTLAGNYQIIASYPQLLGPSNRLWFHFWSYKFGRLLLPFALIVATLSGFGLPSPWAITLIGLELLALGLAAVDPLIAPSFPLKRLSSLFRTFSVLMLASLSATRVLFGSSAHDLWKPSNTTSGKL